jgi:hypothetical protein
MTIRIENKNEQQLAVGLRFLLDTHLGEKRSSPPFVTNVRSIFSETVIGAGDSDRWWISRNDSLGLMGSIPGEDDPGTAYIHMANWKRFNDVPWKFGYSQGRNFNFLPYSVGDSAVCYYYEPASIARGEERTISIQLAAEEGDGFARYGAASNNQLSRLLQESVKALAAEAPDKASPSPGAALDLPPEGASETPASASDPRWVDLITIRDLLNQLDSYIAGGGTVSEEELAAIELIISRLQSRYTP